MVGEVTEWTELGGRESRENMEVSDKCLETEMGHWVLADAESRTPDGSCLVGISSPGCGGPH